MATPIRIKAHVATDPRAAELRELAASEGIKLPLPIDMILWYEDRGYVVNLATGQATRADAVRGVTSSGRAVAHLLSAGDTNPYVVEVDRAEIDALLEEVYGKPNLGIEDSAARLDTIDPASMSEADFWAHTAALLDDSTLTPWVQAFDDRDEDFDIGEDKSRRPYLY